MSIFGAWFFEAAPGIVGSILGGAAVVYATIAKRRLEKKEAASALGESEPPRVKIRGIKPSEKHCFAYGGPYIVQKGKASQAAEGEKAGL